MMGKLVLVVIAVSLYLAMGQCVEATTSRVTTVVNGKGGADSTGHLHGASQLDYRYLLSTWRVSPSIAHCRP